MNSSNKYDLVAQNSNYTKDVINRINESEVSFIDMTKQLTKINMDEVGDHVDLPY